MRESIMSAPRQVVIALLASVLFIVALGTCAAEPPSPPLNLEWTYGDGYIDLTWEEPQEDHGTAVERYHVYRYLEGGQTERIASVDHPALTYHDDKVENGREYFYYVTAESSSGEGTPSNEVTAMARTVPGPPRDVEVLQYELFVLITWDEPLDDGGLPIVEYRIYNGLESDNLTFTGSIHLGALENLSMIYLHPMVYDGLVRYYYVTSLTDEGESEPSSIFVTTPFDPPSVPLDLQASAGDGEVTLTWHPPLTDGGAEVEEYGIYRMSGIEDEHTLLETVDVSVTEYMDRDVHSGLEYSYRVSASNLAWESELTEPVTAIPAGVPSPPINLTAMGNSGSVALTWDPSMSDGGLPISGYMVYRLEVTGRMEGVAQTMPDVLTYTDRAVENDTLYLYAVSALSDAGESERSEFARARPYGPPSRPLNVQITFTEDHVMITWASPQSDGGSAVEGYNVVRDDPEAPDGIATSLGNLETVFSDHDVKHGRSYTYTVSAFNAAGTGDGKVVTMLVPEGSGDGSGTSSLTWTLMAVSVVLALVVVYLWFVMRPRSDSGTDD
jgi:fibronectin type 3 domain-containing protein